MSLKKLFVMAVVLMATASMAQASIIGWECADDGDGAIDCIASFNSQPYVEPYVLSIEGDQFWGPGHMDGSFTTDTELDPVVGMFTSIENDTTFEWTAYQVNVSMNKTFSLSDAVVSLPTDWTASITQPTLVGSEYVGTILYQGGTPVTIGGSLDFGYKMAFLGSVQYCQEMIPIPEPTTLVLLSMAGIMCLIGRRRG